MFENQHTALPARVALGVAAWEDSWTPTAEQVEQLGHVAPDGENPVVHSDDTDVSGATAIFESYWAGEITEVRAGEMLTEWTRRMGLS